LLNFRARVSNPSEKCILRFEIISNLFYIKPLKKLNKYSLGAVGLTIKGK
jgi:hypothetical protein